MSAIDGLRKAFDDCTVMAGVENDFECIYITKNAALLYLNEIEAENAKLRELVRDMAECIDNSQPRCKKCKFRELNCQWFEFDNRMRELGMEVDV